MNGQSGYVYAQACQGRTGCRGNALTDYRTCDDEVWGREPADQGTTRGTIGGGSRRGPSPSPGFLRLSAFAVTPQDLHTCSLGPRDLHTSHSLRPRDLQHLVPHERLCYLSILQTGRRLVIGIPAPSISSHIVCSQLPTRTCLGVRPYPASTFVANQHECASR